MYWNQPLPVNKFINTKFNNNIRCIEIKVQQMANDNYFQFNNNIRCIEIFGVTSPDARQQRLITT